MLPTSPRVRLAALLVALPFAALADPVVSVYDGDTLTLAGGEKVRLSFIDAPELKSNAHGPKGGFAVESRDALRRLCLGVDAQITRHGKDKYGRTVAEVSCRGQDVSTYQVQQGMARVFPKYTPPGSPLYAIEQRAREEHRGIWK